MNHYQQQIIRVTACTPAEAVEVESIMRSVIFKSTLDWQTAPVFAKGAQDAYELYKFLQTDEGKQMMADAETGPSPDTPGVEPTILAVHKKTRKKLSHQRTISDLITELERIKATHGDLRLTTMTKRGDTVIDYWSSSPCVRELIWRETTIQGRPGETHKAMIRRYRGTWEEAQDDMEIVVQM